MVFAFFVRYCKLSLLTFYYDISDNNELPGTRTEINRANT